MAGSNRKNLGRQLGMMIPTNAPMTLHATTVVPGRHSPDAICFTCKEPIDPGQRVRWCAVEGFVPAGYIHAQHFDAGPIEAGGRAPRRKRQPKRPRGSCSRHRWSAWRRAGIFDSTEIRTCQHCSATRTRRSSSKSKSP